MKNGWPVVKLNDVCEKIQDGAHRSPQVLHPEPGKGRFPYLTSKNIRTGYLKLDTVQYCEADFHNEIYPRCNAELGDVLLTKDGANTGNVAINTLDEPFSLLSSVCLLKPDSTKLLSSFLYYYIQSDEGFEQITGQMTGAAIKRIILKTIKASRIPLAPLAEQRRIVGILDEAFAGIATAKAHAEQNLQNARALFESHLNAVFTQRGDGWVPQSLAQLCTLISGRHIAAKDYNSKSVGIGYLTGPADFGKVNPVISKWTEHPQAFAQRGDILITVKGAGVGKLNLLDAESVAISRQLMAIRVSGADPGFIYAFLDWNFDHFQSLGTGATVPGLSREDILDLDVPLPAKSEQKRIVAQLDSLQDETQRLESIYQRKLAALDELKKSLLHQAFSGKL